MCHVPIINVEPLFSAAPAAEIDDAIRMACSEYGFMYLSGHGISSHLVTDLLAAINVYFSQEDSIKNADAISRSNYRGYIPQAFFTANDGQGSPDNYEGYKLHAEISIDDPIRSMCGLYGPNIWPTSVPQLRGLVEKYWRECDRVSDVLLRCFARLLDIDEQAFLGRFNNPLTNVTLLHYPAQTTQTTGIHPHKDTDVFTLLPPGCGGGLKIRPRGSAQWMSVRTSTDAILLNIGDMMEVWSGGRFVSTPHMVVGRPGLARHSFPYFCVPRYDVVIAPLVKPISGFERAIETAGAISHQIWSSNWSDAAPIEVDLDPRAR